MDKPKPIEPGCLVLIIGSRQPDSPNVGKMGTVRKQAEGGEMFNGIVFDNEFKEECWVVDGPGLQCFVRNIRTGNRWDPDDMCLCRPQYLLRIDPEADPLDVTHEEPIGVLT